MYFKKNFNWSIIALSCCVNFCYTTWISHTYTYIPSFSSLPPKPHPTPPGHHGAGLPVLYIRSPLAIYFTHVSVCINTTLPIQPILSFPAVSRRPFCMSGPLLPQWSLDFKWTNPNMQALIQLSAWLMFADAPLAKASHVTWSRVDGVGSTKGIK